MVTKHSPKRILIVDDEAEIRTALAQGLASMRQAVHIDQASNGSEGLIKAKTGSYDLIITDYLMNGMSGLELAEKIHKVTPNTPIMIMTAVGSLIIPQVAGRSHFIAHLDKPLDIKKVCKMVEEVLTISHKKQRPTHKQASLISKQSFLETYLNDFLFKTQSRLAILLDTSGHRVATVGHYQLKNIDSICALIAASFMASAELARMLGNDTQFKASRYEGPNYDIYAHHIRDHFLLAVIFGMESKAGIVRFYAGKLEEQLKPSLDFVPPDKHLFDEDFSQQVDSELNHLFGT